MRGIAVIGAGYGDEGKGAITALFSRRLLNDRFSPRIVVARCNGGGQAAHTVYKGDLNHVFRHHGSGTLDGVDTYLSKDFIVNPIVFYEEREELAEKVDILPSIYVSPDAIVTLPMDIMINHQIEISRGADRHGSCGWGIGETVQRAETDFPIRVKDLLTLTVEDLQALKEQYGETRLKELGIEKCEYFDRIDIDENYIHQVHYFLEHITMLPDNELHTLYDVVIFEGAQGLGLDQKGEHFPHVTRSNTGLTNIIRLAEANDMQQVDVYYVTRCYSTRHGAGPLEREGELTGINFDDPTNIENLWQGAIRTAPLDFDILKNRIFKDMEQAPVSWTLNLAMTCLDQIEPGKFFFVYGDTSIIPDSIEKVRLTVMANFPEMRNFLFLADKKSENYRMSHHTPTYQVAQSRIK